MPKSRAPNTGWKPRATFHRDGHRGPPPQVQERLKTCAAAATERLQGRHTEEVKESQEKYDRGGNTSYPRTGRDHKWRNKKQPRSRHISLTTGDQVGKVRGETHDADTDFEARTHASLDKRARRRSQGGRHRHPTGGNSGRKRGRDGTNVSSSLSATPGLRVVPFHPDEIGIPDTDDGMILVQGQFCIPRHEIVSFLGKKHHLVYSTGREDPATVSVESSRDDEPVNAGPVTTAPSSMAEPTPAAESAPATSSSVVDPMLATESAAEAPSSLAESTPPSMAEPTSVVRPDAETPSSMAEPTTVVRPAAEVPSSMVEPMEVSRPTPAAPTPSLLAELLAELIEHDRDSAAALPSPGGEAGPTSTYEEEVDDWDIVDHEDFPALPTYPKGAIDFTRLNFDHVELVPLEAWTGFVSTSAYGDDVEAISNARRALLTRFLERQLTADRILTLDNPTLAKLNDRIGGTAFLAWRDWLTARERGFTRIWKYDFENRCYFLRDRTRYE